MAWRSWNASSKFPALATTLSFAPLPNGAAPRLTEPGDFLARSLWRNRQSRRRWGVHAVGADAYRIALLRPKPVQERDAGTNGAPPKFQTPPSASTTHPPGPLGLRTNPRAKSRPGQ